MYGASVRTLKVSVRSPDGTEWPLWQKNGRYINEFQWIQQTKGKMSTPFSAILTLIIESGD